ncbi:MAG TPA: hypothetical protein VHJ17_12170 [Thermomonospora sp.]|nr:hypothetical protein [Thermomonospora sp.]
MNKPSVRHVTAFALVLAAGAAAVGTAGPAGAVERTAKPRVAGVSGHADIRLPYHPDADVRSFTFHAQAAPYTRPFTGPGGEPRIPGLPTDAKGTVRISHHFARTGKTITADGRVDALVTAPGVVTLTAIITRVDPDGPPWMGRRLGFSVYDGGPDTPGRSRDRVGFSWDVVSLTVNDRGEAEEVPVGTGLAPAPFAPVTKGGYTVVHADLPPMPPR